MAMFQFWLNVYINLLQISEIKILNLIKNKQKNIPEKLNKIFNETQREN